jgi:two-component system CheB/CheR fusion protein
MVDVPQAAVLAPTVNSRQAGLYALELIVAALGYVVLALLGLALASAAPQVSLVWPVSGAALALLVLRGARLAPAVAVGAFAANLASGAPLAAAAGIAAGNTLEALLGAALATRMGFQPGMRRRRDVYALLGVVAPLAPIAGATLGVASLAAAGAERWSAFGPLWLSWWLGDALGILLVAPFVFTWVDQARRGWRFARGGEAALLVGALVLLSAAVFSTPAAGYPLHYLIFPGVIWCALRLGQPATASVALGSALAATTATLVGRGPFVSATGHIGLLQAELFTSVIAATGLVLGAVMAERNRAERRQQADFAGLQDSEQRLALALAAGHMGAWEWDVASGRVRWSEQLEAIHGLAPGTFRGTFEAFRELVHPGDLARVLEAIERSVKEGSAYALDFRVVWPDGSVRWNAANGQVVRDERGGTRMVGVCRDVTEAKRASDAIALNAAQLEREDRRKDEFLAVLAHELRNPLAPLQNAVSILAHAAEDTKVVGFAHGVMERQLRHLVRLVDDLLDLSRIRSGKILLARERVELARALRDAVEMSQPAIDARGHALDVLLPEEPIVLDADPTRLPQLVANLLNNAAKFTPDGGRIGLVAAREGGNVVIRVRDTGIGMTAEALSGAFELFAQARSSHAIEGGLGVGLSVARALAELHGGTLEARSEGPGRGSEFVVRLPVAEVAMTGTVVGASRNGEDAPPQRGSSRRAKVLVCDDNVEAADTLVALLEQGGHEARATYDGAAALRLAREYVPEVIVLDLGMPRMDGYAVARAVREDPALARMRLVALSGYGRDEDRRRTAEAGFHAHLVKPVDVDALVDALVGRIARG